MLAALAAHSRQSVRGTLLASITGPASTALEFIGMESSIEDILKEFQRRYLQSKTVDQWRREFFDLMQGPKGIHIIPDYIFRVCVYVFERGRPYH